MSVWSTRFMPCPCSIPGTQRHAWHVGDGQWICVVPGFSSLVTRPVTSALTVIKKLTTRTSTSYEGKCLSSFGINPVSKADQLSIVLRKEIQDNRFIWSNSSHECWKELNCSHSLALVLLVNYQLSQGDLDGAHFKTWPAGTSLGLWTAFCRWGLHGLLGFSIVKYLFFTRAFIYGNGFCLWSWYKVSFENECI